MGEPRREARESVVQLSSDGHNVASQIASASKDRPEDKPSMASEPSSGADVHAPGDIPGAISNDKVKDEQVRERAYLIWVDEGRPHGRELDHWLRAKWELRREPNP